jgi:hypothetical protein
MEYGTARAIAYKNIVIGRNHDATCAVGESLGVTGRAGFAERHQHLAIWAELDHDGGSLRVGAVTS